MPSACQWRLDRSRPDEQRRQHRLTTFDRSRPERRDHHDAGLHQRRQRLDRHGRYSEHHDRLATSFVVIPFSSFSTLLGSGANFKNVGAVQLQVTGVDGVDGDISLIDAIGPNVQTVNMQNFNQLSLGNLVWNDANNNGLFNSANELGMGNVKLDLYSVSSSSSTFTPGSTPIATTTTNSNGGYLFTNLFPGNYIVQVDPSNFNAGRALAGYEASTGLSPVPATTTASTAKTREPRSPATAW